MQQQNKDGAMKRFSYYLYRDFKSWALLFSLTRIGVQICVGPLLVSFFWSSAF
jgi:hypothetical protein